jgi:hypothetical protein
MNAGARMRMKDRGWIEPIVERVVGQVLDSHAGQLRTEIVRRVREEIAALAPAPESASEAANLGAGSRDLARSVAEIQLGASQREILRALLDTSSRYAARVALFVVKGTRATGWQARGFADNDAVKDFALDETAPAVMRAIGERGVSSAPLADMDSRFLREFGKPDSGEGRIFPLILKDKVAALVYADPGGDASGLFDAGSLELMVLSTSAWLEVNSLRKQAQTHADSRAAETPAYPPPANQHATPQAAAHPAPAFSDPFASHTPAFASSHAMAAAAAAGEVSVPVASAAIEASAPVMVADSAIDQAPPAMVEIDSTLAEPLPIGNAAIAPEPDRAPAATMSPEEQDVHRKAQRFARLLVDEIKLYNQAKVAEGRKNKDLYDRLKETIEKSRATYQKRYGSTVAASANYFQHEIIRSLAEDNPSIMGANFRQ